MVTNKTKGNRGLVICGLYEACKGILHKESEGFLVVKLPRPISIPVKYKFDEGYRTIVMDIVELWVDKWYLEATIFETQIEDGTCFEWSSNKVTLNSLRRLIDEINAIK